MNKQTEIFQRLIDKCPPQGHIKFPVGTHLIGSLFLKSNMTLEIPEGCVLLGSEELEDYPLIDTRVAGIDMVWPAALINAINCKNVSICGRGTINGQGKIWWEKFWGPDRQGGMLKDYESKKLRWVIDYDCMRPQNILVQDCQNVKIQSLYSKDSGFWNIHLLRSTNIQVNDVRIENGMGPSTDGIDIDSCRYVTVSGCYITCNDDNICIKAGRGKKAHDEKMTCRDIVVKDCVLGFGEGATLGSEVSGGIENITFQNIKFNQTRVGFRIKSSRNRGGFVRKIKVDRLEMVDVDIPIQMQLDWFPAYSYGVQVNKSEKNLPPHWYELLNDVKGAEGLTTVEDLSLSNIKAKVSPKRGKQAFLLNGYEENPIKHVRLRNIQIEAPTFGTINGLENSTFENVHVQLRSKTN